MARKIETKSNITKDYVRVVKENEKLSKKLEDYDETKEELKALKKKYAKLEEDYQAALDEIETLKDQTECSDKTIDEVDAVNQALSKKVEQVQEENARLQSQIRKNSSNSSIPTGRDLDTPRPEKKPRSKKRSRKSANKFNGRTSTKRRPGGQFGHPGSHLSEETIKRLLKKEGVLVTVEDIGDVEKAYESEYVVDLVTYVHITEVRYHGKREKKKEHKSKVSYGPNVKTLCVLLNNSYNLSYQKISYIVKLLSRGDLSPSTGSVHSFCKDFESFIEEEVEELEKKLLDESILCTDSTVMLVSGKRRYIRVFCNDGICFYSALKNKTIQEMEEKTILKDYDKILVHDHETALYHFGSAHQECNVHILRYLRQVSEETGHSWSELMVLLVVELLKLRQEKLAMGKLAFEPEEIALIERLYDRFISLGYEESKHNQFKVFEETETTLLNRLKKYKQNHLLFLRDLEIPPENNLSERNLRPCKLKQKNSGGFRTFDGLEQYAKIRTFIDNNSETPEQLYQKITDIFRKG